MFVFESIMTERLTCLITGASSGIGVAIAEAFAARGYDLVLTARREDRLQSLAHALTSRYAITAIPQSEDLADPSASQRLLDTIRHQGRTVDALVNNAGFGMNTEYHEITWADANTMLQVMLATVANLCHSVLPDMRSRNQGCILNVASLAGLLPGMPKGALYNACKAFVIKHSESLAAECAGSDIRITALCPGYVHTEFHQMMGTAASMQKLPNFFWLTPKEVAQCGLQALDRSQVICVPGKFNQSVAAIARIMPNATALQILQLFSKRFHKGEVT